MVGDGGCQKTSILLESLSQPAPVGAKWPILVDIHS